MASMIFNTNLPKHILCAAPLASLLAGCMPATNIESELSSSTQASAEVARNDTKAFRYCVGMGASAAAMVDGHKSGLSSEQSTIVVTNRINEDRYPMDPEDIARAVDLGLLAVKNNVSADNTFDVIQNKCLEERWFYDR